MKKNLAFVLMLSMFNFAYAAQDCQIDVSELAPAKIEQTLERRGYIIVEREAADYELIFDEFTARPVFKAGGHRSLGADDPMISVKGHVVMKINKFMSNGKKLMQFGLKQASSIAVRNGETFKEARQRLLEQLVQSNKLAKNIPTCNKIN
jgi:hypothetical protein